MAGCDNNCQPILPPGTYKWGNSFLKNIMTEYTEQHDSVAASVASFWIRQ